MPDRRVVQDSFINTIKTNLYTHMSRTTGAQLVVESLRNHGVKYFFFLPGSGMLPILDRLYDTSELRSISCRHEQSAVHIAEGYARASGKTGVVSLHNGPGVGNGVNGIANAYLSHTPLVVLTEAVSTEHLHRDSIQELNHLSLLRSVVKWNAMAVRASRIPDLMAHAFRTSVAGRKGPTHLDIPRDVLFDTAEGGSSFTTEYHDDVPAKPEIVMMAADLLLSARYPFILAGGGVVWADASSEVMNLAEKLSAPVATSFGHNDAVSGDHPLYVGGLGRSGRKVAKSLAQQSDVILAIGTRISHFTTYYSNEYIPSKAKIIHVDSDPHELGRNFKATLAVPSNAKLFAAELSKEISRKTTGPLPRNKRRIREISKLKSEWETSFETSRGRGNYPTLPQIFRTIRKILPRNAIICLDEGSSCSFGQEILDFYEPRTYLSSGDLASLGFAFPASLGAKLAKPDRNVVSISGDGGFSMTMVEMGTAKQYDIPFVAVVLNNHSWGSEKAYQKHFYNERYLGVDLAGPDFVKLANSFDVEGLQIQESNELEDTLKSALTKKNQVLVEIQIDPEELSAPARSDVVKRGRN